MIPTATHRRGQLILPILIAAAVVLLSAGVPEGIAIAQEQDEPQMLTLTLNGAVELAIKQNLDLQTAHIETAIRQQDRAVAASALLPHAELDANDSVIRYNTKAQLGIQPAVIPHEVGPYQVVHAGPSFSTPIFDLTLIRQYQASGHRLLATRADEETVREETVLLTVSEYMAHLRALASISAAQSRVDLASRLVRQAEDLLQDGVATKIDVSRSQVRLSEEQQKLIDAQSDADTTLFALKRILNDPDNQQIAFADCQNFFSTPSADFSDSLSTALNQRPELGALSERMKAAQSAHKAAVDESLPKLVFEGGWNEQGETFARSTPGYDFHVGLSIPIFTGGRLRAERKRTALQEQQSEQKLAEERNVVTQQVRDGQVELQAALHQVVLGRQQVGLANDEVSLSLGRFQAGVTDNIEVTAAQDSLARANDAEIGALFRYNVARAKLAWAAGQAEQTFAH